MSQRQRTWGKTPDGVKVDLHTITNETGYEASITTYGATLTGLKVPASDGQIIDVVLGFDQLSGYLQDKNYMGSTVGRVANRISQATFKLSGKTYLLDKNEGENHLHGGKYGFNSRVWEKCPDADNDSSALSLYYFSPDGEGGYPGNLEITVIYSLVKNGLRILYRAETDQPTPVNITAHPYFNLNGDGRNSGNHELKINSEQSLISNESFIPNGELIDVTGTEADFTKFVQLDGLKTTELSASVGHDRFYPLNSSQNKFKVAAITRSKTSGMEMEILSTQPGIQFYSGDYISKGTVGKDGCIYGPRSGFCLEPMAYPDAPNRPEFPSVILSPGDIYEQSTEYRFREY